MKLSPLLAAAIALAVSAGVAHAQRASQRLPAQIPIENARAANLTELSLVDADGKVIGRLARPLAAGAKATMRLQRGKGCDVAVRASFDDEGEVDETVNLCREKRLRFVGE
jgi:hypothetical protein